MTLRSFPFVILGIICSISVLSAQTLIKDINTGSGGSQMNDMIIFNGHLVMMGDDGWDGAELWKSDGTTAGTVQIKDIYSGSSPSYPANFAEVNGELFFRADNPLYGFEIWKTDLTNGGTTLLKDVNPGPDDGVYTTTTFDIVPSNGQLYMALDDGVYGRELWTSDGTSTGTIRLLDTYVGSIGTINGAGDPKEITPFGNGILFSTYEYDLGTGIGKGRELWRSNGTVAGTVMIKDIHPDAGSSNPDNILVVGSNALFSASGGDDGDELWKTDGTNAGTVRVKDINTNLYEGSEPRDLVRLGTEVLFFADDGIHGAELWKTDGTEAGTVLVKDINPGATDSYVLSLGKTNFITYNGELIFMANDGTHGREPWITDGTTAGTRLLKDINPGSLSSYADYFAVADGKFFCYANDGTHGYELWTSNGTPVNTYMFADINAGPGSGSPNKFFQLGDELLFRADNGTTGSELFSLDLNSVTYTLPVELLDFQAEEINGQVRLDWLTAMEQNHAYFAVERSLDGANFEEIGRVQSEGDTESFRSYEMWDLQPEIGHNYYRLRQVDLDGTYAYSHLVAVRIGDQARLSVYPNPVQDQLTIRWGGGEASTQLKVRDMAGRLMWEESFASEVQRTEISSQSWPGGVYLLEWQQGVRRLSQWVVKE